MTVAYSRKIEDSIDEKSCDFCKYIREGDVLKETNYFVIIPNRYPIEKNQIMLIPKRHIHSELDFQPIERKEFIKLHLHIIKVFYKNFNSCFYFNRENTPAQSIWHFHRHYLPTDNPITKAKIPRLEFTGIELKGL